MSRPWEAEGVGEVWNAPRKYNGAKTLVGPKTDHVCGQEEEFRAGEVLDESKPRTLYLANGLPTCCGVPVPARVVDVSVAASSFAVTYRTPSTYPRVMLTARSTVRRERRYASVVNVSDNALSLLLRSDPYRSYPPVSDNAVSHVLADDPHHAYPTVKVNAVATATDESGVFVRLIPGDFTFMPTVTGPHLVELWGAGAAGFLSILGELCHTGGGGGGAYRRDTLNFTAGVGVAGHVGAGGIAGAEEGGDTTLSILNANGGHGGSAESESGGMGMSLGASGGLGGEAESIIFSGVSYKGGDGAPGVKAGPFEPTSADTGSGGSGAGTAAAGTTNLTTRFPAAPPAGGGSGGKSALDQGVDPSPWRSDDGEQPGGGGGGRHYTLLGESPIPTPGNGAHGMVRITVL